MPTPTFSRRTLLWTGLSVALVATGIAGEWFVFRAKAQHVAVAAYLVPLGETCRVKSAWWHSTPLTTPRALHAGERIAVPYGTSLQLIHADNGAAEFITGPAKLFLQQKAPSEIDALVSPLPEVLSAASQPTHSPAPEAFGVVITSPVNLTRYLNPLITWTARDGIVYDVAVLDPADENVPPRIARAVRSPIALAELQTPQRRQLGIDRNYEIVVRLANAPAIAAAARCLTTIDAHLDAQLPATPAALIAEAAAAMVNKPARTGDAWLALTRLPADWAKSELGVRLRLRVAAELGHTDELARAQADATALLNP